MYLLYHAYMYLEFLILACTIYILAPKRVIGAPGDTVEIRDNAVYVNHKQIEEPYLNEPMKTRDCICKLKEDEWFVMGDNRNHSLDSRAFGAVRTEEIRNLVLNG